MKSIAANGPVAPLRHGVALGVLRSNDQIKFRRRLDRGRCRSSVSRSNVATPSITNRNRRTFGDEWRDGSCWKFRICGAISRRQAQFRSTQPILPSCIVNMAFAMSEANTRKIIHVDMDAFYASVEQRDDPSLRGRPVAVGYAARRGVVASASYEARAFGVRSAMPSSTALRKCPDLMFVPPRFEVYRAVSHQIRAIFADYTALIEPLSLDEAYLDVSENLRGIPTASATAAEIRARIFDETGLTASAGISYNKFLAKLASDHCK